MKKTNKVAKTTLAAVLATSAIVPTLAVQAEETVANGISKIIVKQGDQLIEFDYELLNEALISKLISISDVEYLADAQGNYVHIGVFNEGLLIAAQENPSATVEELFAASLTKVVEAGANEVLDNVLTGEFTEEGLVGKEDDTTPEENIIETFFYNFAA